MKILAGLIDGGVPEEACVPASDASGSYGCRSPGLRHQGGNATLLPVYFPAELQALVGTRILQRGQQLFGINDPIRLLFFVVEGEIRLMHALPDGREIALQTVSGGGTLAECSICLSTYSCSAVATLKSHVASIPVDRFQEVLTRDNDFAVAWSFDLASRLRDMYMREERLKLRSSRERVLHYLVCHQRGSGPVQLQFSARAWAMDLGLSHENLYRTLAALEQEGVLRREGRKLVLLAPVNL